MTFSLKPTEPPQAILLLPLGGAVMHMRPEATAYCFRSMKVSGARGHHGPPVTEGYAKRCPQLCLLGNQSSHELQIYIYHYLPINIYKP